MAQQILHQWRPSITKIWDVASLSYVDWDGSLSTGALTIGTVDQGTPGAAATPWYVTSGLGIVAYDHVAMVLSGGNTIETYTFKTGGAGGTTVATVTVTYTDSTRAVFSSALKT